MKSSDTWIPVKKENVHARVEDASYKILSQGNNLYVANNTAYHIWELIDGSKSVQDITDSALQIFRGDRRQIMEGVQRFLHNLKTKGLIE